jgi:hypothetical protein
VIKQRIDAQRLSVDNSRMSNSNGTPDFKGFVDMGDSECAVSAGVFAAKFCGIGAP